MKTRAAAQPAPPPSRTDWRAPLAVIAVALGVCIAGVANQFVNDDIHLIAENARVQGFAHAAEWFTKPFWPPPYSPDLYRPLLQAWLAIQYVIGDGAPVIFRFGSYLLYAACCVAALKLFERLLPKPFALGAALLFAAHPVHVEAVALAVGQAELTVGLIALVMSILYIDWRRAGDLSAPRWLVLAVLYLVACLVKEQGFVLPALLVAIELTLFRDGGARGARFLRGSAAFVPVALIVLAARRAALGDVAGTFTSEALVGLGVGGRALTMLAVVPEWLRLLVWPIHLRGDYSPSEFVASTGFGVAEASGVLILLAVIAIVIYCWRRASVVSLGLLWCAVALVPVSNVLIPTGILIAERTLFLPSVGVLLAIAAAAERWAASRREPHEMANALGWACAALAAMWVGRSGQRELVWRNEGYFVARGVQDSPRSFRMQESLGNLLFAADRPDDARKAYAEALRDVPPAIAWRVRNDFARDLLAHDDIADAVAQMRASVAQRPDQEYWRGRLIVALLSSGAYAEASAQADSALAHGATRDVFARVKSVADSALRVGAAPGSVRIGLDAGQVSTNR